MNSEEKILEMLGQMQADLTEVKDDWTGVKDDLFHIKARLDFDVDKRLKAINEGVDAIQETMVSKGRVEQLEDDV